jgi:hypothetical protein
LVRDQVADDPDAFVARPKMLSSALPQFEYVSGCEVNPPNGRVPKSSVDGDTRTHGVATVTCASTLPLSAARIGAALPAQSATSASASVARLMRFISDLPLMTAMRFWAGSSRAGESSAIESWSRRQGLGVLVATCL